MGVMTGRTVFIYDRAVMAAIFLQQYFHVRHRGPVCMFILLVMTGKAEIHGRLVELLGKRRDVRVMTGQTAFVRGEAAVFYRDLGYFILLVGMTGKAEALGALRRQVEFKVAAVGTVTLDTAI